MSERPVESTSGLRWLVLWASFAGVGIGALPASADEPLHQQIDRLIAVAVDPQSIALPAAADAEFLRRVYLDLTGVIPSVEEARRYLDDSSADKRRRLVDDLLAGPQYARHMQRVFDVLLMQRRGDRYVRRAAWQKYLHRSFATNKRWNQLVTELLSADGTDNDNDNSAAAKFYLDRRGQTPELVRDISGVLLGRNLGCAQCHDHPIILEYEQAHFYGLAAFLDRGYLVTKRVGDEEEAVFAEKAVGQTSFASALTGVEGVARPRVFDGPEVDEPAIEKGKEYVVAPKDGVRAVPKFSRREQLAPRLIAHPAFSRNIVNRLWAMMMGRGLVDPVDQHAGDNPPSHPELLDLLARDIVARDYDLRAFLRELALTDVYARSNRSRDAGDHDGDHVPAATFTGPTLKPLSPDQLAWSLLQATGRIGATQEILKKEPQKKKAHRKDAQSSAADARPELTAEEAEANELHERLAKEAAEIAKIFVTSLPGQEERTDATADQALFLLNAELIQNLLSPAAGNLLSRLRTLRAPSEIADELYLSVLSRHPRPEEREWLVEYLTAESTTDSGALTDLVSALLSSTEFRFNH